MKPGAGRGSLAPTFRPRPYPEAQRLTLEVPMQCPDGAGLRTQPRVNR